MIEHVTSKLIPKCHQTRTAYIMKTINDCSRQNLWTFVLRTLTNTPCGQDVFHITDWMTHSVQFYMSGIVPGVFFKLFFFHQGDKWHDKKLDFRGGGDTVLKKFCSATWGSFLSLFPCIWGRIRSPLAVDWPAAATCEYGISYLRPANV